MRDELRLWAIPVDAVRAVFAAPPDVADRLRHVTTARFPVAFPGPPAKFGPLRRHPRPLRLAPGQPSLVEAEAMLRGQFLPPERLDAAWTLLVAWLDDLADQHVAVDLTAADRDAADFDLARAGVAPDLGLTALWRRRLDLPLTPQRGRRLGWLRADEAHRVADAWEQAEPELTGSRHTVAPLGAFLKAVVGDAVASWRD
jgi:hypothetical protein